MECRTCHLDKPLEAFAKSSKNTSGHDYRCKECARTWHKEYALLPKIVGETIRCSQCHIEKSVEEFHKSSYRRTGYISECKLCASKRRIQYVERTHMYALEQEACLTDSQRQERVQAIIQCRTCNIEKPLSEFHRQKGAKNGFRRQCKSCRKIVEEPYRLAHMNESVQRVDAWRKNNPERFRALAIQQMNRRRARETNAPVNDLTIDQWRIILEAFHHRCAYCGRKMQRLTQDHITPLSQGGSHTMSNIVPACRSCNSKKGTRNVLKPVQPLLF